MRTEFKLTGFVSPPVLIGVKPTTYNDIEHTLLLVIPDGKEAKQYLKTIEAKVQAYNNIFIARTIEEAETILRSQDVSTMYLSKNIPTAQKNKLNKIFRALPER